MAPVLFSKSMFFFKCLSINHYNFLLFIKKQDREFQTQNIEITIQMEKREQFHREYNPPFYLHKISNYQKAVYERKGHWTEKEKVKYGVFLQIYREKFQDRENPILNKMFRVMSDFVKTRNHNQCRSHHQKMERERFEIDSILESIRSKYHPREYELLFQKYSKHIQALNVDSILNEKGFTPHKNVDKRMKKHLRKQQAPASTIPLKKSVKLYEEEEQIITQKNEATEKISLNMEINQIEEENKITEEKKLIGSLGMVVVKQDKQISQIASNQSFILVENEMEKQLCEKNGKELKKTGIQYDSDQQDLEQKPEAVFVDIPMEENLLKPEDLVGKNLALNSHLHYQIGHNISPAHHLPIHSFGGYQKVEPRFNQTYMMGPDQFMMQENYNHTMRELEDKKKWHLNEAGRLCNEMNEHLQQANICDQMKEGFINKMMDFRRQIYYSGQYSNSQF